ncbi:hypothetical protein K458DRAFT_450897 [Lentithecium fluviatile CBS 122367]|uniref:Uncharacterized protein n=1 Tax=Lentithecium fluviatile CBS 122367 TaxID=1168545 RepID=A0A6G1J306_9PLEO|nr:hypothetical protein K458DRAFT_450897 [Lentithecium fluviatile CBS 122367]
MLSSGVTKSADQIKVTVEETLALVKTVEDSSSKSGAGTEQLLPRLEEMNRVSTSSFENTEQMTKDFQHLKAQSAAILADLGAGAQMSDSIDQTSMRIFLNTQIILQRLERLFVGPVTAASGIQHSPVMAETYATDAHRPRLESGNNSRSRAHSPGDNADTVHEDAGAIIYTHGSPNPKSLKLVEYI